MLFDEYQHFQPLVSELVVYFNNITMRTSSAMSRNDLLVVMEYASKHNVQDQDLWKHAIASFEEQQSQFTFSELSRALGYLREVGMLSSKIC